MRERIGGLFRQKKDPLLNRPRADRLASALSEINKLLEVQRKITAPKDWNAMRDKLVGELYTSIAKRHNLAPHELFSAIKETSPPE